MGTFPNQGVEFTANAGTDPSVVALTTSTVSVGNTSTAITTLSPDQGPVVISNSSSEIVYLGNSNVTTTTGYELAESASVLVTYDDIGPDQGGVSCSLHGITSTSTSTVTYLVPTNAWGNE